MNNKTISIVEAQHLISNNAAEFVNMYMELQDRNYNNEVILNRISNTLPDTNRTFWWITNLIKVIQLIIEILKNRP